MALGNSLEDALDAIVELEVIGFQFSVEGETLHYQGTNVEEFNCKQTPIPDTYINKRLDLIRVHKPDVIAWLQTRNKPEILRCLERVLGRVQERAKTWQWWAEFYRQQSEYLSDHSTKVYHSFQLLEAELNDESGGVLQEVNTPAG
jgi:hypothetical protein